MVFYLLFGLVMTCCLCLVTCITLSAILLRETMYLKGNYLDRYRLDSKE